MIPVVRNLPRLCLSPFLRFDNPPSHKPTCYSLPGIKHGGREGLWSSGSGVRLVWSSGARKRALILQRLPSRRCYLSHAHVELRQDCLLLPPIHTHKRLRIHTHSNTNTHHIFYIGPHTDTPLFLFFGRCIHPSIKLPLQGVTSQICN